MSESPHGISALIEEKLQEERKLIARVLMEAADNAEKDLKNALGAAIAGAFEAAASIIERGEYRKGERE